MVGLGGSRNTRNTQSTRNTRRGRVDGTSGGLRSARQHGCSTEQRIVVSQQVCSCVPQQVQGLQLKILLAVCFKKAFFDGHGGGDNVVHVAPCHRVAQSQLMELARRQLWGVPRGCQENKIRTERGGKKERNALRNKTT